MLRQRTSTPLTSAAGAGACAGACFAGLDISAWRGQRLVLHVDHASGVRDDHRLENLRLLCPRCHSQTATYCNRKR